MAIYIVFYLLIFALSFKIKKDKFTFCDFVILLILILFSGLRSAGIDYFLYQKIFDNLTIVSRTGTGFRYLMYFFKNVLNLNYQSLIFFVSFLTNIIFYFYFKKNSQKPGLSLLIYISAGFYTTSFNMFRQTLSMGFVLLGSECFKNKKYLLSLIVYFFAFSIHSSSIIAIISYIILFLTRKRKIKFKYLVFISVIILIFYDKYFYSFLSLFESMSVYRNYDSTPGIGTFLNVLVYLLISIFLIIPKYKNSEKCNDYYTYNLFLIGLSVVLLELKNFLFFRIAFYFTILTPIVLTDFYIEHNFNKRKIESLIYYICLFIYFLVYVNSFDGVVPYNFFFNV